MHCKVKLLQCAWHTNVYIICCGWHEFYRTFATMHRLARMPQTCLLRLANSMGRFLACHNLELFLQTVILEHSCGHLPGHSLGHRTVLRQYTKSGPISTMMGEERRWTVICLLLRGVRTKICSFQHFLNNVFRSMCYWWFFSLCCVCASSWTMCAFCLYLYYEDSPPPPFFFFCYCCSCECAHVKRGKAFI